MNMPAPVGSMLNREVTAFRPVNEAQPRPDERPAKVIYPAGESSLDADKSQPVETELTWSGRVSKPPQRLISDPVWSQKASVLLSLVDSRNQEHVLKPYYNRSHRQLYIVELVFSHDASTVHSKNRMRQSQAEIVPCKWAFRGSILI